MKARWICLLFPLFLTGCLFSLNHPVMGPDGTAALFLDEDGTFGLFLETGTLHLLRETGLVPIPAATAGELPAVLDWSPGGDEILFVSSETGEWLQPIASTLYRVHADPDAVPVVVLTSEAPILHAAFGLDGRIVILRLDDEGRGRLETLDPEIGRLDRVFDDVRGFRLSPSRETLTTLHVSDEPPVAMGAVMRWSLGVDNQETLARFVLNTPTAEMLAAVSDVVFWDADPTGRWVALALYGEVLLEPLLDSEGPSLFLVDTEDDTVSRIADLALGPSFSPDGKHLAYIASEDGETGFVVLHDLDRGTSDRLPDTEAASTCFWLAPDRLGLTFEINEDRHRLVEVDLKTGSLQDLMD